MARGARHLGPWKVALVSSWGERRQQGRTTSASASTGATTAVTSPGTTPSRGSGRREPGHEEDQVRECSGAGVSPARFVTAPSARAKPVAQPPRPCRPQAAHERGGPERSLDDQERQEEVHAGEVARRAPGLDQQLTKSSARTA